ncbi:MAG: GAF domain-containing protein [Pseudomonadota bacterium]|nr:GAF domain-containing protein [Pseudomonadota bacterium]
MFGWLGKRGQRSVRAQPERKTEDAAETGLETCAAPASWAVTMPMSPPVPLDAQAPLREAELRRLAALQARGQAAYQYIAETAARICGTPMAAISLLDGESVWLQAAVGLTQERLPLSSSFCPFALAQMPEPLVVHDAQGDPRFAAMPLVVQAPGLRFYAGAPFASRGVPLGTVSVADTRPRELTPVQLRTLQLLAQQTALLLQARVASSGG